MNCKLEEQQELQLQKRIIYSVVRDFGASETALMCGLREDQTDLIYKYSNNPDLAVPAKRWRNLSQSLTNKGDCRIVREYAHPSVLVSLFKAGNLNGCFKDELLNIMALVGKISEECQRKRPDSKLIAQLIEQLGSEGATLKEEIK